MFTSGQVPQARLDDIVRRLLFALFDSGVFDDPVGPAQANVSTPEHRGLKPHHTSPPQVPEEFADFCARMVRRYAK